MIEAYVSGEDTDSIVIAHDDTPTWHHLLQTYPNTLVKTSGEAVGLPDGQMVNSEVGHMNLGARRVVYQNFTRINKAIKDNELQKNSLLCAAIDKAIASDGAVHFTGLLSPGGVHSHEDHLVALLEMAKERGAKRVYVHAILDGRDMPTRDRKSVV